jgi:hypothetical protein
MGGTAQALSQKRRSGNPGSFCPLSVGVSRDPSVGVSGPGVSDYVDDMRPEAQGPEASSSRVDAASEADTGGGQMGGSGPLPDALELGVPAEGQGASAEMAEPRPSEDADDSSAKGSPPPSPCLVGDLFMPFSR